MKYDFVVFGATGIQGRIVTKDLLENGYFVLMCGRDKSRVEHLLNKYKKTSFEFFNANNVSQMSNIIRKSGAEIVVNCVEGDWNLNILKACVNARVNSLDLGSDIEMTRDQIKMSSLLKRKDIVHITGCGSVPGIGNVMLRYAHEKFDKIKDVEVGFAWDSNLKVFVVPFSIQSIIEEFTAPAPFVLHKKVIKVRPMDSIITCYHRAIGREKQFKVGHHPETYTFYNFCKNKGIENVKFFAGFPEHSMKEILAMIDLGLGSWNEVFFNGSRIKPIEFLTEILKGVEIPKGYKETENLWVHISGSNGSSKKLVKMECIVPTLKGWEDAGCNVDTGMPASIIAQMIKKGLIKEKGSFAPENIVPTMPFFDELRKRNMFVYENGKVIN